MTFVNTAAELSASFGTRAARYDAVVMHNKCVANVLETTVAICIVLLGAGGAANFFASLRGLGEASVADAVWGSFPTLVGFVMAVLMAYIKVMQPREKQARYGAASAMCATVATVAKVVTRADLGSDADKTTLLGNLLSSTLTTLEAAALDDQPPLPGDGKKKD